MTIGRRQSGPRREEGAGLLPDRGGLAQSHGMARQADDDIRQAPRGAQRQHLRGRAMTVTADQERGGGPVAPESGQEPAQEHGRLRARRTPPRSAAGGHQGGGGPCTHAPGQRASTVGVRGREGPCLRSRGRGLGVIEVEDHGGRGRRVARNAVVNERLGEPGAVRAIHAVFQPRHGGGARQVLGGGAGWPLQAQRKHGGVSEALGLMAVRIAGGDVVETLGNAVTQGRGGRGGMSRVLHGSGQTCAAAHVAVDAPAQQGPEVG